MITTKEQAIALINNNPQNFEGLENVDWFKNWLEDDNFHLFLIFQDYAVQLRTHGKREYYGSKAIWEHMRWDTLFSETANEYKLSNNATAYLSRLTMLGDPSLNNLFRIKRKPPLITQDYLESL